MRYFTPSVLALGAGLVLFNFGISAYAADSGGGLTIEQALQEAVDHNLGLKGEDIKTAIKKRAQDLSFNQFIPSISVRGGVVDLTDPKASFKLFAQEGINFPGIDALDIKSVDLSGNFTAQLRLSIASFEAIRSAEVDYSNSVISREGAEQKLKQNVRKLFQQLLLIQETIKLKRSQIDNAAAVYHQAQVNLQAGLVPELTALQAQVAWENLKPSLDDLLNSYTQVLFSFEYLLGRLPDPTLTLQGSLDVPLPNVLPTAESLIARFIDRRLDLQAARGHIRAADVYRNLQDSLLAPSIVLQYSADPLLYDPFGKNSNNLFSSSQWVQQQGGFSVSLAWSLDNLIPGSIGFQQRAEAADNVAIAQNGLEQETLSAQTEIMTLDRQIRKSVAAMATLKQNIDVAKRAYQLTQDAYKSGSKSLLEVQSSELQYESAQLSLLNEKQVLDSAIVDLETALNTPREEIYGTH